MQDYPIAMEITIKLQDVQPATWRTLLVPISIRYDQLHVLLQLAFGWENEHLYGFWPKGHRDQQYLAVLDEFYDDPTDLTTDQAYPYPDLAAGPVIYEYDFGDSWDHEISLKHVLTAAELDNRQLPSCVRGSGPNRQEDSRGMADADGDAYDRKAINQLLAKWAKAGDQLISGPGYY